MTKVCRKVLLSERFEMDNSSDESRRCAISAVVTVEDGRVSRIERGRANPLDSEVTDTVQPGTNRIADFDRLYGQRLNVRFGYWEGHDNSEVLREVEAFIEQCELNVANQ